MLSPPSVTINGLGTPTAALEAAKGAISLIDHYPPADFEPALTDLAKFIWCVVAGGACPFPIFSRLIR